MIEKRNAEIAAMYMCKGKSEKEIIKTVTKLALNLNDLTEALDKTNSELQLTIHEVNKLREKEIKCTSESKPDYLDYETCYINSKLLSKIWE